MIVLTLHLRTEKVLVITQDGRTIVVRPSSSSPQLHTDEMEDVQGSLEGFDQTTNVILSDSTERVYSMDEGVEEVPLGLYVVRGDNIVRCSRPVCRGGWELTVVAFVPSTPIIHSYLPLRPLLSPPLPPNELDAI